MMSVPGRIGGLRFIRGAVLFCLVMITLLSALMVGAFVANEARVDDIQNERYRNTVLVCVRDSAQNQKILDYLAALGAKPASIEQAERFFPVLTAAQCERQASARVSP